MTEQMPTSDLLNKAADDLERHGWMQLMGHRDDAPLPRCAGNAIFALIGEGVTPRMVRDAQLVFSAHLGGRGLTDIWEWNDAPGRTKVEVVATLRAAALIEAAKENEAAPAEVSS